METSEIILKRCDGREYVIKGFDSHPKEFPVVPWCHLSFSDSCTTTDNSVLKMLTLKDSISHHAIMNIATKHIQNKSLSAIVLLTDERNYAMPSQLENCEVTIVAVSLDYQRHIKSFLSGQDNGSVKASVIPLIPSLTGILLPKSLESSQELFRMVCHVVRDGQCISTDKKLFLDFLQRIRAYCLEKDFEIYRAVFTRISEILLKRKDIINVISRDFPAYLIFADVLERDSSLSNSKIQMLRTYVCRTMSFLIKANIETVKETIDVLIKNEDFSFESFGWSYKSIFNSICETLINFFREWYRYSNCKQSFGSALHLGLLCVSIVAKLDRKRSVYDLWRKIILLQFENNIIDSETVEELGKSLSDMSHILDDHFTDVCTWRHLALFFLSKRHPFMLISYSLDTFLAFRSAKDLNFNDHFVEAITKKYTDDSFEKDLSVKNIREGVLFVKHLQRVLHKTDQTFDMLPNWIKFLVDCIDAIPEEGPIKIEVMTPEANGYIDEVDEMISDKLMCDFLKTSKHIPSSLKNKSTKELLEVACTRSGTSVHHYIFDFVLKIGQKCERMESLLVDIASLRISLLLASSDREKCSSFLSGVVSEVVQHRDQCFQDVVCTLLEILPHAASTFQEVILEQSLKMIDDDVELEPNCSLEPVFLSILEKIPGSLSKCTSDCTNNISLLLKVFEFIFQKYKTQYLYLCNLRDTTCQFFVHFYTTVELFIKLQASFPVLDNIIEEVKDAAKEINDQLSTKHVTFGSVEAINKSYCNYTHLLRVCSDTHHTAEYVMELARLFADYATKVNSLLFWKCQMDDNTVMKILLLSALEFYFNFFPSDLQNTLKELFFPEGSGNQLHYVLKETASLKNIINLYDSFSKFFSPLEDSSLETVAFSYGSELVLLKKCLKFSWQGHSTKSYFSLEPVDKMICINTSISNAELLLKNLLFGEECILTVEKMCDSEIVDTCLSTVEKMNLFASSVISCNNSEVMDCFIRMKEWKCNFAHFKDSISSMCKLIIFQDHFETLKKVCDQFQLQKCLKDKNMTTFKSIVEKFITEKESCPLSDCIDMSKTIEEILKLPSEEETHLCFEVLSCITHYGPPLYNFAVERNISSRDSFVEQYRLVTAALNSDDTYDVLLNQLFGAMSLLFPIFDSTCTLESLLTQIADLTKKEGGMKQLEAVCLNIDAIKLCFDSTKGESPKIVQNNLLQILKTGKYVFSCHNNAVSLFLVFEQFQISDKSWNRISWCNDQTITFEQKLEYHRKTELNSGEAMEFRLSLKTARKIQQNYQVMRCFGCKIPVNEIEVMKYLDLKILVERTTKSVTDIKKATRNNRHEYKLLSLLSMPKMRNLHLHLQNGLSPENIIEDVGLIMECDDFCRYSRVDCLHSKLQEYLFNEEYTPSKAVGVFLHHLWPNSSLFDHVSRDTKHSSNFKLFTASNFSNFDKIRAICSIFNGLPKCIQLLRCSPSTSKDDIELFFDRINNYPSLKYLLLGVNLLSLDMQQVVIKCSSELYSRVNNGAFEYQLPRLCLIEYSASVFRNLPWISSDKLDLQSKECVKNYCKDVTNSRFCKFDVVKGLPGSGKTFSIKKNLKGRHYTPLSIHEGFTSLKCIKWLKTIDFAGCSDGVLYINFLIYMEDQKLPEALLEDIHWFFFDCFIFGYVEDPSCGLSVRFSKDLKCSVYAEVPYWNIDEQNHTDDKLQMSYDKFCEVLPVFDLLGNVKAPDDKFDIESNKSQLIVFKYLKAYNNGCLDRITRDNNPVLIGMDKPLEPTECKKYLNYFLPRFVRRGNRLVENLFLSYMQKRCEFLEEFPHLKFNSGIYFDKTESINTRHMRSILFSIMLEEVYPFCDCKNAISSKFYKQLVYRHDNSAVTFKLFVSHPECLTNEDKERLQSIGVTLPSLTERSNNLHLHQYLSAAFNIPLTNEGVIKLMVDEKFILTRDFFRKLLNIHERRKCRIPVIIQGETGVGKTFLVEFLSKLWNFSWLSHLKLQRKRLKEFIVQYLLSMMYYEERITCTKSVKPKIHWVLKDETKNLLSEQNKDIVKILSSVMKLDETHNGFVLPSEVPLEAINADNLDMTFNKFKILLTSADVRNVDSFMESLFEELGKKYRHDPSIASLVMPFEVKESWSDVQSENSEVFILMQHMFETNDTEMVAPVVYSILYGGIKSTFFKYNLHAAVTPEEVESFFREVTEIASLFLYAQANYEEAKKALRDDEIIELYEDPTVTVFLDEVNTCSYPGLLKEIIVDHSINGRELQKNIFIVASCNPFRANSVISLGWFKGTYNVHPLPPSLDMLKWDYSAMQREDELEYITEKLKLFNPRLRQDEYVYLPRLINNGQELIRKYAKEHLLSLNESESNAETLSSCAVSQRDIQRVFILYEWLLESFDIFSKYSNETRLQRNIRAIFVACAITYYFRLNELFRDRYEIEMDNIDKLRRSHSAITFKQALNDEMEWLLSKIKLHSRIACTKALKENVYAIVVCSMTRIPLIIIGPPGSSKTISFKIVVSNFQGVASEAEEFRDQKFFKIFDPYPYQCSRASTSIEIESVFDRAINRQETLLQAGIDCCSVVLLDEAGLPEEKHESLKALHYYLDKRKVSFVAISNHVLDAAKSNRAISLYRPPTGIDDLLKLAGTFFPSILHPDQKELTLSVGHVQPTITENAIEKAIQSFVYAYHELATVKETKNFRKFFGLRDFIHFLSYLHRKTQNDLYFEPKHVAEAVERNFNGKYFELLLQHYLNLFGTKSENVALRSTFEILQSSISDLPSDLTIENEVRYKLLIDSSEDLSLTRFLFLYKVLSRSSARVLIGTRFSGETESESKMHTVSSLCYSAARGETVLLIDSEDIQECFYNLFNQQFTSISNGDGKKIYFTTVSIGSNMRLCEVSPNFQCVVVVKQQALKNTQPAFLNRFEKYSISYLSIANDIFSSFPMKLQLAIENVTRELQSFVKQFESTCFYGFTEDTITSLVLTLFSSAESNEDIDDKEIEFTGTSIKYLLEKFFITFVGKQINSSMKTDVKIAFSTKILTNTLKEDADYISCMLKNEGDAFIFSEDINELNQIIDFSVKWLMTDGIGVYSTGVKFFVTCLEKFLFLSLVKHILSIMTPEAFVIHMEKLDPYFRKVYIQKQSHFSFGDLLQEILKSRRTAKNILCFTRTSHLLHEVIPNKYFWTIPSTLSSEELKRLADCLQLDPEHIYKLSIYRIMATTCLKELREVFNDFRDNYSEVLLLVADVKETSVDVINHVRLLMENCNQQLQEDKVVILLLHFPSSNFFKHCYPSLFINGWKHRYLDTIGYGSENGSVNIAEWLMQSFGLAEVSLNFIKDDDLNVWLKEILPLACGYLEIQSINAWPNSFWARHDILKQVLFSQHIKPVLFARFRKFWTPFLMITLSRSIAVLSARYQSTRGISDLINSAIKATFTDFVLYLLFFLNSHYVFHTIHSNEEFFDVTFVALARIMEFLPIPHSREDLKVEVMNNIIPSPLSKVTQRVPAFPFFKMIYEVVEQELNQCGNEYAVRRKNIVSSDQTKMFLIQRPRHSSSRGFQDELVCSLQQALTNKYEELCTFRMAVLEMENSEQLFLGYSEDLLSHKMRKFGNSSRMVLRRYLLEPLQSRNIVEKISRMHIRLRVHDSNVMSPFMLSILHIIDLLEKLEVNVDNENWVAALTMDDNSAIYSKSFTAFIEIMFHLFQNLCSSPKCNSEMNSLWDIYISVTNLECASNVRIYNRRIVNLWLLIEIGLIYYHHNKTQIFLKLFTYFETKMEEPLKVKDVFDGVCLYGFDDRKPFHDSSFVQVLECILNHFYVRFLYIYQEENDDLDAHCDSNETINWLLHFFDDNICFPLAEDQLQLYTCLRYFIRQLLFNDNEKSQHELSFCNSKVQKCFRKIVYDVVQGTTYVPRFYRKCPSVSGFNIISKRYILADLYFDILVEELSLSVPDIQRITELTTNYSEITNKIEDDDDASQRLMLLIEKQAIIHVMLKHISVWLAEGDSSNLSQLPPVSEVINEMFDRKSISVSFRNTNVGPGLVLILRLLQASESVHSFRTVLAASNQYLLQDFDCVQPIKPYVKIDQNVLSSRSSHTLFQIERKHGVVKSLHQNVCKALRRLIQAQSKMELMNLASESYTRSDPKLKWGFNMVLMVVIYEEIYKPKKWSDVLVSFLQKSMSQFMDQEYIKVLLWLAAAPQNLGSPDDIRAFCYNSDNAVHFESIIRLVSVVMGCPPLSTHLWTHLFDPVQIKGYSLPATLLDHNKVVGKNCFYSDLIKSNDDFSCLEYTNRGTMSFQSSTFVQWANYAMLFFSILVNPQNLNKLRTHNMFPDNFKISEHILESAKKLWGNIGSYLNIKDDGRQLLTAVFCTNLYEKFCDVTEQSQPALIPYEQTLHELILRSFNSVKNESVVDLVANPLKQSLRYLSANMPPVYSSRNVIGRNFLLTILSSTRLHNPDSKLFILYQYMLKRHILNAGGFLLPYLVFFYRWMHDNLSCKITLLEASTTSFQKHLDEYLKEYFPMSQQNVLKQFQEMKDCCKVYVKTSKCGLPCITETTTVSEMIVSNDESPGLVLNLINRIIDFYNGFISCVMKHCSMDTYLSVLYHKTDDQIPLVEVSSNNCCFGSGTRFDDINDLMPIIEKHFQNIPFQRFVNHVLDDTLINYVPQDYDLWRIQCDIIKTYLGSKMLIESHEPGSDFKFKLSNDSKADDFNPLNLIDQDWFREHLRGSVNFEDSLQQEKNKEFCYSFHSIHQGALFRVVSGLNIVLKYVVQVSASINAELAAISLDSFIEKHMSVFPNVEKRQILAQIGIMHQSMTDIHSGITEDQYVCLCSLEIRYVLCVSEIFTHWLISGFYEFCALPFSMKTSLPPGVIEVVHHCFASEDKFKSLTDLIDLLLQLEQDIVDVAYENFEEIISVVMERKSKPDDIVLIECIPQDVQVQHYVWLLLELRKILTKMVEQRKAQNTDEVTVNVEEEKSLPVKENVKNLSVTDVSRILDEMNMADAAKYVNDNEINGNEIGETPPESLDSYLAEIGLTTICQRIRFKVLFERKRRDHISEEGKACSHAEVVYFCQTTKGFNESSIQELKDSQLDGEMLLLAIKNDECIKEMNLSHTAQGKLRSKFPNYIEDKLQHRN